MDSVHAYSLHKGIVILKVDVTSVYTIIIIVQGMPMFIAILQVQGYSQHNYKQEMIDSCAVKVKRPELIWKLRL